MDEITDTAPGAGHRAAMEAFARGGYWVRPGIFTDHAEMLMFGRTDPDGQDQEVFWTLVRPSGSYLVFPRRRGAYRIGRSDRLWELCWAILHAQQVACDVSPLLARKFRLEDVDSQAIVHEGYARLAALRDEIGWNVLVSERNHELWEAAFERLYLDTEQLRARRPPSMAWDLSGRIPDWRGNSLNPEVTEFRSAMNRCALRALRASAPPGESIFCLDYNHTGYRIDPRNEAVEFYAEWWPIAAMPGDSWALFTTCEFAVAMYVTLEQRIYAFGADFAARLKTEFAPFNFSVVHENLAG